MTEPRTVWAVSSGEYSDYRVLALFEREQDATDTVQGGLGDDTLALSLFPPGVLPHKVAYWQAYATVMPNGELQGSLQAVGRMGWAGVDHEIPGRRPNVSVRKHLWDASGRVHSYPIEVTALTEKAAIKAASDAVAKLRAEILEREQAKPKPGQKPDRRRPS